jgi:outer membrane lipoprotein-sorting protein
MRSLFFLITAGIALAQLQPEALQILQRSQSALQQFGSGEIEVDRTTIGDWSFAPTTTQRSLSWSAPGKMRLTTGSSNGGQTFVSDGRSLTTFDKATNEYVTREAAFPIAEAQRWMSLGQMMTLSPNDRIAAAKIVRDEKLPVGGAVFDCSVLEIEGRSGQAAQSSALFKLWIDKGTGIILHVEAEGHARLPNDKVTSSKTLEVVRHIALDSPIDETRFAFDPPANAKKVRNLRKLTEDWEYMRGEVVPDMGYRNLDDTPFKIESLRGKAIVMSFGTTTCEPWRAELAQLSRLQANIPSEDAAIILVDVNESAGAALRWRTSNSTAFPLILARKFAFGQCPMNIILDKNGTVRTVIPGIQADAEVATQIESVIGSNKSRRVKK